VIPLHVSMTVMDMESVSMESVIVMMVIVVLVVMCHPVSIVVHTMESVIKGNVYVIQTILV